VGCLVDIRLADDIGLFMLTTLTDAYAYENYERLLVDSMRRMV
jgi:hypothetical protein